MKKLKTLLIDDDFFIRQIIKILLNKFGDKDTSLEFYSSYDGVEGLGFMYVTNPDIVILDATLPKYSGREVVEYLISNKHFVDKNVIVLSSKDKKVGVLPENYIVLEKESNTFTNDLFKTFTYLITGEIDKKKVISKSYFSSQIIKFAHASDTFFYKITSGNLLMKLVNFPAWFAIETLTAFAYTIYSFFVKKIKDANIKQEKRDLLLFRVKSYPAVALVVLPLVFLGFQLFLYVAGGIAISNIRVQSIFANSGTEVNLDLTKSSFDSSKLELSNGITLKSFTEQVPIPVSYGAELQPSEITRYFSDKPSVTFDDKVEFSQLVGIAPTFTITNNAGSSYDNSLEPIQQILTESSLLDSNGLTFQLSPDKQNWYYFDADKWKKTELGFENSNNVLDVNKNINLFERDVSFDSNNFVGTLYLKAFFSSNGDYEVSLTSIKVLRVLDVIEVTTISTPSQEEVPVSSPVVTPSETPSSFPEVTPTPEVTQLPPDVNADLSVPVIFQATFDDGNKLIYGKILENLPDGGEVSVEGYYTDSTDITKPAINMGEYIGSAKPLLNANGELIFLIVAPSREGGYVTTRLVRDLNGQKTYSTLSHPLENSTYTVDNTGDQSDSDTGDGLCLTGSSTCTLRAAIEQANQHSGSDTILFNISTSSSGFRTYSLPNTSNSGSVSDDQSYWTIRPGSSLPVISGATIIDGSSQTSNQGNYNNQGPEIEIRGNGSISNGLELDSTSDNSTVEYVGINNFSDLNLTVDQSDNFNLLGSHIGIDIRASAATTSNYSFRINSSNNIIIGSSTATGNYFANSKPTGTNTSVVCGSVSGTKIITYKGNKLGVNYATTAKVGSPLINAQFVGDCNATIGGSLSTESNIFAGANFAGLNIDSDNLETNSDYKVYKNYFGTNATGTVNLSNFLDISLQDWLGGSFANSIKIGNSGGRGNLFRYSSYGIAIDHPRPIAISYNTFGNIGNNAITVGNQYTANAPGYSVVSITNNQIGQSSSDPYFSLNITGAGENGIVLNKASAVIKGNIISTNGKYGILSRPYAAGEDISRTNGASSPSVPVIGGSAALTGSLCTNEANCIKSNTWGGVYSLDGVAFNESTIYTDNNWTGGNGNGISYEQSWLGLAEIISGTVRRTDLANGSQTTNFSVNQRVKSGEDPASVVTSASNLLVDCITPSDCPASGATSGTAGKTMIFAPSGANSSLLTKAQNWFNISEYVINNAGVKTTYGTFNSAFTYDGNSTTNPLAAYPGKGEPWSDSGTANRDLATANFGRFQIGETEVTDANPSYDGINYTIIVDTTTDEDNVSLVGVDDGGGVYSGGGSSGVDGPANGKTSLREAIIAANNHPGPERIHFSIPTTDSGYRDYDSPNTSSSGDSTDGDDYWTIRPTTALPSISSAITLDASTQETNQGDKNSGNPDIELNGVNIGVAVNGLKLIEGASSVVINKLIINRFSVTNSSGIGLSPNSPLTGITITNNVIGLDSKAIVAASNYYGITNANVATNTMLIQNNIIAGNSAPQINFIRSVNGLNIYGNIIGLNSLGNLSGVNTTYGINISPVTGTSSNINIGDGTPAGRNVIASHTSYNIGISNTSNLIIRGNYIGTNLTGTASRNATGTGIITSSVTDSQIGGPLAGDRNIISGHTVGTGINPSVTSSPNTNFTIQNNFIGTDVTGTQPLPNTNGITVQIGNVANSNISIKGNLIRFNNAASITDANFIKYVGNAAGVFFVSNSAAVMLEENEISDNYPVGILGRAVNGAVAAPGDVPSNQGTIRNNIIGSGTSTIVPSMALGGNNYGIRMWGSSMNIYGNKINGNTKYGIENVARNAGGYFVSRPQIGGTSALTGSLCTGVQKNCISGNGWGGIYSVESTPYNEATLATDNDFGSGNTSGINIEQSWFGLLEIFSGTIRRTDLTNATLTVNFPASTRVKTLADPTTVTTSGTNYSLTCTTPGDCPASGATSGVAGQTEIISPFSTSLMSDQTTWYHVSEYTVANSGTVTNYSNWNFNQDHITSKAFSFDANSTSSALTYPGRGEPWASSSTANRDIATAAFGLKQILEVDLVDANPIFDGVNYTITVDSTSDEDNVSTNGVDDGAGVFSGGGGSGPSGNADGKTSLREAIQVANRDTIFDRVYFSIPTSDSGYRDYDSPDTSSSGDSTGGDDYWTIRPTSSLPDITKAVLIDGTTQTTNRGDLNTQGPEIEVSGISAGAMGAHPIYSGSSKGILFFSSVGTSTTSTIKGLVINNAQSGQGIATFNPHNLTIQSNYIGTDVKGITAKSNTNGVKTTGWAGMGIFIYTYAPSGNVIIGGSNPTDGNLISGNSGAGVSVITDNGSFGSFAIQNNYIGTNKTGTSAIANFHGISLGHQGTGASGNFTITDNVISGNTQAGISLYRVKDVLVQTNIIGLNPTQTAAVPNNRGIDWRNDETTIARNNVVINNNVMSGHTTQYAIMTIFAGGTTTGGQITNNIIGTNALKNTSLPNVLGMYLGNWSTGLANINIDVDKNTIWNSSGNYAIFVQNSTAASALNITSNDIKNNFGGILIYGGVNSIKGNSIQSNSQYGILVSNSNLNYSRTNSSTHAISKPIIGGQNSLTGSLCSSTEKNCISSNGWGGVYSLDAVPANESSLWADNNFTGGNGSSGSRNIEQGWYGLFELNSAVARRTDLANGSYTLNFPSGTKVRTGDDPSTEVTSGTNLLVTCLNASDCPASAGNSSGTASSTEMIVPAGSTASILSNALSWYRVTQYIYNGSGVMQNYANFSYQQSHLASKNFSFDGQSTTDVLSGTGSSHVSNSITYTDRGEPWSSNPAATRDIPSSDLGRFQIMEVDLVDANPVLNSGVYEITVERTSDEDNVSLSGVDDGGGAFTGGGGTGPSGIADGKTSLREAVAVANNITDGTLIKFNIPTSDTNYNTSFPGAFRIQPTSAMSIYRVMTIDGTTQTTFTGDTKAAVADSTVGPEIILDLSTNASAFGFDVNSGATIKALGIYNNAGSNRAVNVTVNNFSALNNDFVSNAHGAIKFNINAGNYNVTGNIFRANTGNEAILLTGTNPQGGTISSNVFIDNALPGMSVEASPTTNLTISTNRFINNGNYAIEIYSGAGASGMKYIINNNVFQNNLNGGVYVVNNNNYRTTITNNTFTGTSAYTPINIVGGTEDSYGATANDPDDSDTGANDLMNSPVISVITYIGGGQYRLTGNLNNKVSGEGPYSIEICESDDHISGHGGCIRTLGTVQNIAQVSDGNNPWTATVTIAGDNGTQNRKFSALATNTLGSTSEFSSKFANGRFTIQDYPITLVSPKGGVVVTTSTPSLVWNANGDPDIANYEVYLNGTLIATVPAGQTSYTLPSPIADGNYNWQVKDKRVNSTYGGVSVVENFTVDTTLAITLISPIDGVSISNPTPTLTWNPTLDPLIQNYQVYLDGNLITTVPASQHAYTAVTPLNVGLHNWQIKGLRAANVASGQSIIETFNRTPSASQDIILIGPIGGIEITESTPTLSWNPTSNLDVVSYEVYLDGNLISTVPVSQTSLITSPIALGNHTWQVKGIKSDNAVVTLSVIENFNEVYRVYLTTPSNNATISTLKPVFSWSDTHNTTVAYFKLYLNGNLFKQVSGYSYTSENEIQEGNYEWYIESYNSSDQLIGTSSKNNFTIKQVFILNVDTDVNAGSKLESVNIVWNLSPANPPADSTYTIKILDASGVTIIQVNNLPNNQVSYSLTPEQLSLLTPGVTYTVSVSLISKDNIVIAQGSSTILYTLQISLISNTLEGIGLTAPNVTTTATTLLPIALVGLTTVVTSSITAINVIGVLFGILIPRKRRYWGIVFDVETSKPLAFTTIRVINKKDNKIYQTVSDLEGRYGINVERAGSYIVSALLSNYQNFEKEIIVLNPEHEVIEDIALTRLSDVTSDLKLFIVRNKAKFVNWLNTLLLVLTILGFIYTLFVTLTSPIPVNFVILSMYLIIFFLNSIILFRTNFTPFKGRVINKTIGLGVEGVVVRLFTQDSKSVTVAITDENGLMRINIPQGSYIAKATKAGFVLDNPTEGQELTRVIVRKDGYLEKDIVMKPASPDLDPTLDIEKLDTPFGK